MPVEDAALTPYSPDLRPEPKYSKLSVTESIPFQGGQTRKYIPLNVSVYIY